VIPVAERARQIVRRRIDRGTFWFSQFSQLGPLPYSKRRDLVKRVATIHVKVACPHSQSEIKRIIAAILAVPATTSGMVVEAGCFKGGSTAKLSIATRLAGRRMVVFDSFEGLPPHSEKHDRTLTGERIDFVPGRYRGRLDEVRKNVHRYGEVECCEFVQGWFAETLPHFQAPIVVGFIDVDLAASTRTCLEHLYPRLVPGGTLFSHDGNLPLCMEVMRDERFWRDVGEPRPIIAGLGTQKLVSITKPC
jgi:O-methyltransferase